MKSSPPIGETMEMRYIMNQKEEMKAYIIQCCIKGNMTVKQAANRLGFTERYVKKLKARYKKYGVSSMLHGNCGRQPKKTLDIALKQKILEIHNQPEFNTVNVAHFREILEENFNISVSYSFLYNFLLKNGIKSPRKHRKTKHHHRRKRRSQIGELLQIDATPHEFFAGDSQKYTLHGLIDDASGQITGLYMCKNECMQGYFEVMRQTLNNFGVPENIYADGSSIFFPNKKEDLSIEEQLSGMEKSTTQFGKIMETLGIHLIHAGSSQAKGRIERLWNTLHDRLITEFKINHIVNMEQANCFLEKYVKKYNQKFKIEPNNSASAFVPLLNTIDLDRLLTVRYQRVVDNGGCFCLNNVRFKIENIDLLPRTKVDVIISKKIGIKVLFKEKLYTVIPIYDKNNIPIDDTDSIENIISTFIYFYCFKNERIA